MGLPRILLYVVGRIMTALIAGFGLAWDYTGESVLTISSDNWGLIGLICMGFFVAITIFRELDLVLQQRPKIVVKSRTDNNLAILEVHNIGGDANFTAEAIVIKDASTETRYTMCWNSSPHLEHPIKRGGASTIIVAKKKPIIDQLPNGVKGGLVRYQWGVSGVEQVGVTTEELSERVKLNQRYPTMATPVDDSCTMEITIKGTPSLRSPFDKRKYIVKIDHEQGHRLLFTPLPESTPDKEGSQTE